MFEDSRLQNCPSSKSSHSAAFCLGQKLRRDLPNINLYS